MCRQQDSVNNHPMTVVGVAAAGFAGVDVGAAAALWLPASMYAEALPGVEDLLNRPTRWMQILARLRPGVSREQAQVGLLTWFRPWLEENTRRPGFPVISAETRRRYLASSLQLTPAPQGHSPLRRELSQPLWVLFAATGVLLGLACLNVAGLFLARGSTRGREIGTRIALGASRGRIGRQLLADSLLLSFAGGALGIALAPLAVRALLTFLPHYAGDNALRSALSLRLFAFAFLASLVAGLTSGLAPALHASRDNLIHSLRERGAIVFGGVRLRKAIVTLQVALTLILVVGAALFLRTLSSLLAKGPGFDTSSLVSFSLEPTKNGYSAADSNRLIERIHDAVRALPLTRDSGIARNELLSGGSWRDPVTIQTARRFTTDRGVDLNAVSPGFFTTLNVRFLGGRDFDQRDSRAAAQTSPRSAIVNEAFVKRYLAGGDPLGALVGVGDGPDVKTDIRIVGVVTDFNYRGVREESEEAFFPIFRQERGLRRRFLRQAPRHARTKRSRRSARSFVTLIRGCQSSVSAPLTSRSPVL